MTWRTDKRCPTCFKIVESKEVFVHHVGVEHRAVEKFLPEKYKLPNVVDQEPSFPCPLKNCSSDKETKKALLVHLLIVHYQKDMEKVFGPLFYKEGPKKCPKCNMALLDNYLGYMKHIAVEHEFVMNFVDRDINGTNTEKQNATKTHEAEKEDDKKVDATDQMKGNDLLSVLDNAVKSQDKTGTSELPVLNPFFSEESKTGDKSETAETTENEDPDPAQKETSRPAMILVNETASRSNSPESASDSAKNDSKKNQDHKIFDLRAILDSDSD